MAKPTVFPSRRTQERLLNAAAIIVAATSPSSVDKAATEVVRVAERIWDVIVQRQSAITVKCRRHRWDETGMKAKDEDE
jgi:hypothetical protein